MLAFNGEILNSHDIDVCSVLIFNHKIEAKHCCLMKFSF
jgi:hypothetical protein